MKFLFCCILITITFSLQAQKIFTDTSTNITIKKLSLSHEQEITIKNLIWEYKLDEQKEKGAQAQDIYGIKPQPANNGKKMVENTN